MTDDPPRLLDDPTRASDLRRDLLRATRDVPPYDAAAGLARFEATLAAGAPAPSDPGRGVSSAVVLGASLLVVLGAGVSLAYRPSASTAVASGARTNARSPRAASAPLTHAAPTGGVGSPAASAGRVASAPHDSVSARGSLPLRGTPAADDAEPSARVWAPGRGARGASLHARALHAALPIAVAPGARAAASANARGGAVDPAMMAMLDPGRERRQLSAAYGFVDSEPARALDLARQSAREFPTGAHEEWEALAIRALVRLGRAPEARSRAREFLARHPRGAFSAFVRQFAAGGGG